MFTIVGIESMAMGFISWLGMRRSSPPPDRTLTLANERLAANWQMTKAGIATKSLIDIANPMSVFAIELQDGTVLDSTQCAATALRQKKRSISARWDVPQHALRIEWKASLGKGDHFLRQHVTLSAMRRDVAIAKIVLFDGAISGTRISGTLAGCPLVTACGFYAIEHPMAQHEVDAQGNARCYLERTLPLKADQSIRLTSVAGVAAVGQMRRAFADYLEAVRPRKTQPMLHYNCWYDLSYSNIRYDEAGILKTIAAWQEKWTKQRGKMLHSFLLDDGWDNTHDLWKIHDGFPQGFGHIVRALSGIGAKLGLWLSPWGGYGEEKPQRIAAATKLEMEQHTSGLALSGRKYFSYFLGVASRLLSLYHINQFKLDGMGQPDAAAENSAFDSDFDAAIALTQQLRDIDPQLYINLTVGTYASPFWLLYADSIWRGGADNGFAGVGSKRQQWITFRDAQTYANVVRSSSLFPLSSLMLHGIILARYCPELDVSSEEDFAAEVQSFFATGTQCQELYLSHDLMSDTMWDALSCGVDFAAQYAAVLADSHWVGGDPEKLEIYGWAAWRDGCAIITLRNPSDAAQPFTLDLKAHLELPDGASNISFVAQQLFADGAAKMTWNASEPIITTLAPFEVKTWRLQ